MKEGQHWHSTLYGFVPHAAEPRVLLLPGPDGWSLPQTRLAERVWPPLTAQQLHATLRRDLGITAPVLRCVQVQTDDAVQEVHAVFALENDAMTRVEFKVAGNAATGFQLLRGDGSRVEAVRTP